LTTIITKQEVADVCGVDEKTIGNTLRAWRKAGIIPEGNRLHVSKNREQFILEFITGGYRK
jgi:hypothetical protein